MTTTAELTNTVKVDDAGPAKKRLTITIPAETIASKLESSLGSMLSEAALPGFRKGKVPRALFEKRFGESLRSDTKNQLIADAYAQAIEANKIKPVGEPDAGEGFAELKLEPGKPLTFTIDVEVVPEFDLPEIKNLQIKKPVLEITEKHIEEETARQLHQLGTVHSIDGPFQQGDRLTGQAEVHLNDADETFFQSDQVAFIVPGEPQEGRGQVLGLMIDGLDKMLEGKKIGDRITIETVGPDLHEQAEVRGAKVKIDFEIRQAHRIEPATKQQIIERFGLGNEENLREQLKLALEQRRDIEQSAAMREQVFEHLLKTIDFPLPEKLSSAQISRNLDRMRMELAYRGLNVEQIENRIAETRGESETNTSNRLKLMFIVHKLAEHFGIQVSEQEINGYIASMAQQRGERPAALKAELAKNNRLPEVAMGIREHKAADRVIAQSQVIDVSAEEWNKIVTAQAEAKAKDRAAKRGAARPASPEKEEAKAESKPKPKARTADDAPAKKPAPKKKG